MNLNEYIQILDKRYQTGISREHSYRGDLQNLLAVLLPDVLITNEPARIACGAPDYIITRKDIPVGYIEAKDIGVDLQSKTLKEQFDRYRASLNNLIFTDYLDFHFYKDGNFVTKVAIAEIQGGKIVPIPANFDTFTSLIKNFAATISQTIKSPGKLAEMMAGRAKLMADVIEKALNDDDDNKSNSALKGQMQTFKTVLIHDITNRAFADLYAQTIAYGMFAARYHDPTLPTFSRQEAATLIPKTNPFLRRLFQDIAGYDLDDRLVWIVDELVQIFLATDVADIMRNFGSRTKQEDPVIHFYETFLAAYDPKLRKARGVWYTPEPVVNFIVRAVDDILKTEFGLSQGLADTSKTKVKTKVATKATADTRSKVKEVDYEQEVHKVQILDPATGTGTFLAAVVKQIYQKFEGQKGIWSRYVENDLIPRLYGFELLMASYAMAHLKLDLLLTETGFKPTKDQRFRVYLTNSLEESHPDAGTLFAHWLSEEANEANAVKRDAPVMVVIGNPPYSVSSSNKSAWIQNLILDYKKNLNEKKLNLDDDYIKFIRFGQFFIDKNGEGILAYISNNSFVDGITHRQMRKNLLESFDKIYILDLHGSAKKKEVCPDGSADQNVFDIMQGVSINIFVKTGKKKKNELGKLFYSEIYGNRDFKYNTLNNSVFNKVQWTELSYSEPNVFFVPKVFDNSKLYNQGFIVIDLFGIYGSGLKTERDAITIHFDKNSLKNTVTDFQNLDENTIRSKYNLGKDARDWGVLRAKNDLLNNNNEKFIKKIVYRPFDERYTYYTGTSKGFIGTPGNKVNSLLLKENIALLLKRQCKQVFSYVFMVNKPCESCTFESAYANNLSFPLYLYPETNGQQNIGQTAERTPNLNTAIVKEIAEKLGLIFTNEKETTKDTFAPIDILDYIYAVLHSPTYRETYKEFLKIDFPRVPYPKDAATFWALVALGGQLRQIHLLESPAVERYITQYPEDGDNVVRKIRYEAGRVYINETQFFDNVPPVAWEFYIGGYQPAQKWLKDRKDRELGFEDILHYQKIIVALVETDRLMKEIDGVNFM